MIIGFLLAGTTGIQNVSGHGGVDQSLTELNQEQSTSNVSIGIGQEFTPQVDNIVAVDIYFGAFGGSPTSATVKIRENTITGPILGEKTQTIVPGLHDVFNPLIAHFDFDSPISLTPGNLYVIEVFTAKQDGWLGDDDNFGNTYPDGIALGFGHVGLPFFLFFKVI